MNKNIKIGILAGMGPRSTSPFIELVLDECQRQYNAKYDIDYPHMIIYSLPTPFYIDRKVDDAELAESIRNGLQHLVSTGVDIVAIPCNSAHKYFKEITENVKIPVLHIVDETIKNIPKGSNATILATDLTMKSDLYQIGIEKAGCRYTFKDEWQGKVNELIMEIKTNGASEKAMISWNLLKDEILKANVDVIIIACTDLSLVTGSAGESISIIDSSLELAKELVGKYKEMK